MSVCMLRVCVRLFIYTYVYVCMYVCMYVYIYIYIYILTFPALPIMTFKEQLSMCWISV